MRILKYKIWLIVVTFLLSCENTDGVVLEPYAKEESTIQNFNTQEWVLEKGEVLSKDIKKYGEIIVGVKHISALKFIEKTGRIIKKADRESLKNESVFIIEFKSLNEKQRNPLNLNQCKLSYEEGVKYLAFELENNIKILQDDSVFIARGSQFERDFSLSDRLRVITFFKGVNRKKEFNFLLNDMLFGGKQLNFHFSNHLNFSKNS
ncbi:MAG TPA: hypothetical protein VFD78_02330 [Chitinophagaceae bacterium]|nr:hypothetical protein [Chitinophagaceae bacterium]